MSNSTQERFFRLIPSAVDLKLIFFAGSCEGGATSYEKKLKGRIEGAF